MKGPRMSHRTVAVRGDTLARIASSHQRAARVAVTMLAAGVMTLGSTSCGQAPAMRPTPAIRS